MNPSPCCRPVEVPGALQLVARRRAAEHHYGPGAPAHLALQVGTDWKPGTVLTVGFLEPTPEDLADRIVSHMNAWHDAGVNVRFARSTTSPQVRITLTGDGYWSYIGTGILGIPAGQPTMCLQGFSMETPESEYRRVVRHETGHTLGFPHEHSRREIVALLDPAKTTAYFEATQGWTAAMIRDQILTPLDESSLRGTPHAEQDSIMCYQFPAACTVSGRPVVGGADITPDDAAFARLVYPGLDPTAPAKPVAPATAAIRGSLKAGAKSGFVYVTDGGPEVRYRYEGPTWVSTADGRSLVFKGPATRLP